MIGLKFDTISVNYWKVHCWQQCLTQQGRLVPADGQSRSGISEYLDLKLKRTTANSIVLKWDLVGYSGGSPGLENAVKRWGQPIGLICFSVYCNASPFFFTYEWIHGLVHRSEMQAREKVQASPWKTYKRAHEIPLRSRALLRHGSISN